MDRPSVGFIGQGYVGKNYADDFETRGYRVVRYALEEPYIANKSLIKECDIVFVAVPTPTTSNGFDASLVREAVGLARPGATIVIKSTVVPGTTRALQVEYSDRTILFSPEFLSEVTAAHDVLHPYSNVLGLAADTEAHRDAAAKVHTMLAASPFSLTCSSDEAELIKYAHNVNGFFQIILSNLLYDFSQKLGAQWEPIQKAIDADPYISNRYSKPVHKTGRGAGGHCFIKDFAAFAIAYEKATGDVSGAAVLRALEEKNKELLEASGKDQDILRSVYGNSL